MNARPYARAAAQLVLGVATLLSTTASAAPLPDGAVEVVLPPTHFSSSPKTDLRGTEAVATADPIYESGWWYRLEGIDTREHPLPPPDSEVGGYSWSNVDGKGFSLALSFLALDGEAPSGGWTETVRVSNLTGQPRTLKLFHYLDADVSGSASGDTAVALGTRHDFLKFAKGADTVRYRAYQRQGGAVHFAVRPYGYLGIAGLRAELNDDGVDTFADTGVPAAAGDQTAVFEFTQALPTGVQAIECAQVSIMSRMPFDYVRGDHRFRGGHSDVVLESAQGVRDFWSMYRYRRAAADTSVAQGQRRIVGVNDFSGGYHDQLLERDQVTGELFLDGVPVQAPTQALNWRVAGTGDFDHDGRADILWHNTVSNKLVAWKMNGVTRIGTDIPNPDQAVDSNWELVGVAPIDGSLDLDFVWWNKTSGTVVVWYMTATLDRVTGATINPATFGLPGWKPVALGDWMRGDGPAGRTDILWQGVDGGPYAGSLYVWALDQSGTRRGEHTLVPMGSSKSVVAPH